MRVNSQIIKDNMELCEFDAIDLANEVGCSVETVRRLFREKEYDTKFAPQIAEALGLELKDISADAVYLNDTSYKAALEDTRKELIKILKEDSEAHTMCRTLLHIMENREANITSMINQLDDVLRK